MKRNKQGKYIKELEVPTLMSFYIEYADRSFLREQALNRKMTMGEIIRHLIKGFLSKETGQVMSPERHQRADRGL